MLPTARQAQVLHALQEAPTAIETLSWRLGGVPVPSLRRTIQELRAQGYDIPTARHGVYVAVRFQHTEEVTHDTPAVLA